MFVFQWDRPVRLASKAIAATSACLDRPVEKDQSVREDQKGEKTHTHTPQMYLYINVCRIIAHGMNNFVDVHRMPGSPGLDGRDGIPGEPGLDGVPGESRR